MAQNMVSPLVSVLLSLHFSAFCSLAAAQAAQGWHALNFCSNASSALPPICSTDSEIIGTDWSVVMDCSRSDSVIVSYINPETNAILDLGWKSGIEIWEVSLECYPDGAAGGTNEPQDEAQICRSDHFLVQKLGGPYEFSNLSAVGILPGWTCNISACFYKEGVIHRTKVNSCTIPGAITVSASLTTTSVPATTDSTAAILTEGTSTVNATSDIIISTESDFNMNLENLNIYLPVMVGLTITMLCLVLLMAIILSSIRIRRQLARRRALLTYNKQSMVFDPHFYPSVCIDKPAAFTHSPMMSMVSINLLQSLDLTANVYVKEHLPMKDEQSSLNFETDTDDSEAGSIDLLNPTSLNIQKSRSNDDISSTRTEIIVESSKFPERACPQSGGACSEQNRVSSKQGYVQLPHYQQGSVLSPGTITRLDCPSDDNDSVLTEVLSKDNESRECTVAQQQDAKCSTSGYVQSSIFHTTCADEQEMHSTSDYVQSSGFSMPVKGGVHCDGGYIQSSAVSIPIESKDELTNLLDLLSNDETCESDDSDLHQTLSHATTECCREASVYFHPAKFHSAISDCDRGYLKDTLNHISITNETDQEAYRVEIVDSSHSDSSIAFHPPATMDNETRPDTSTTFTSGEYLPGKRENLQPTLSSGVFTNSSTESTDTELYDNIDPDLSTYGYIPSELFTRKILVPASQDSSPAAAGFVVHLDFENRHELLPRSINNLS